MTHGRNAGPSARTILLLMGGVLAYDLWRRTARRRRDLEAAPSLPPPAYGQQDRDEFDLPDEAEEPRHRQLAPDWDLQDEASDESFPASDPAAKY